MLVRNRPRRLSLENSGRTDEDGSGSPRAVIRSCLGGARRNAGRQPRRTDLPESRRRPVSENAMLAVLNRLEYAHVAAHEFRSTFATRGEECTDYPDGAREAALAHKSKSETTAAGRSSRSGELSCGIGATSSLSTTDITPVPSRILPKILGRPERPPQAIASPV
jgi:hypothetical protein